MVTTKSSTENQEKNAGKEAHNRVQRQKKNYKRNKAIIVAATKMCEHEH